MRDFQREPAIPLPEEAFQVEAVDVLECWLSGGLSQAPEWLACAVRGLQPIERRALVGHAEQVGWARESARLRLRLAAMAEDDASLTGAIQVEVEELDRRLRSVARGDVDDALRLEIGRIRLALRPYLAMKLERRERAAFGHARAVVR